MGTVFKPRKPKGRSTPGQPSPGLPDKDALIRYLSEAGEADKGDIANAFGLKGSERRDLREMLRELESEGRLDRRGRRGLSAHGVLPAVGVVDVVERDGDGDLFVQLTKAQGEAQRVRLAPDPAERAAGAPGLGDRLLVRFERQAEGYEARLIKRLGQSAHRLLGVVRKARRETRVEPVDRRSKESLIIAEPDAKDLREGDLVLAAVGGVERKYGPKSGRVLEVVGREDDPRAASLIAIHSHGVPTGFSEVAEAEAAAAKASDLKGRTDLRDLPLITIDPADARDHDDAVYAHPDDSASNTGGWVVWVAIADVAAYVRAGSALDREGREKGNSTYFPDRVEPMLPHRLSSGLCSLVQGENRACLAVRMTFDGNGRKIAHRFVRGLMRSAAKLSYEQAQRAIDGDPDDQAGAILQPVLKPLWQAYHCMLKGRVARSPLAIQSLERRVVIGHDGKIASISPREQLEAHRLIEEMMIQANVCAAETLEQKRVPLLYRIHDAPSPEKLLALADFLGTLQISWSKGETVRTDRFNRLLDQTRGGPHAEIINEVVLRTQMQAQYNSDNIGHFGLNLQRYAHFTSPIRRYADLVVHRGLIRGLGLGADGLSDEEIARLGETAEHVTMTERRSMAAERDATDRYMAAFLADRIGAEFDARVTGVTRFGLFVRLRETGADGLIPISSLGGEYFRHEERTHSLVGDRSGGRWRLGAVVRVRLVEATPITGGLLFEMLSEPDAGEPGSGRPPPSVPRRRGGPPPGVRRGKRR